MFWFIFSSSLLSFIPICHFFLALSKCQSLPGTTGTLVGCVARKSMADLAAVSREYGRGKEFLFFIWCWKSVHKQFGYPNPCIKNMQAMILGFITAPSLRAPCYWNLSLRIRIFLCGSMLTSYSPQLATCNVNENVTLVVWSLLHGPLRLFKY